MNANKPVAWMNRLGRLEYEQGNGFEIPLYTHPASKAKDRFSNYESICLQCGTTIYKPFKELTNEEILQANLEFGKENGEDYSMLTIEDIEPLIGLVKFVLRKAQEK